MRKKSLATSTNKVHSGLLCAMMLAACPALAGGGQGSNEELYVVPKPGNVNIDGKLDDWDLSGIVDFYVAPETRETQSARIAMMYDKQAVYIGGRVRDSSPMMNRHDPLTKPSRAWDADVCQIFFGLDPDEKQPLPYSRFKAEHKDVSPVATMMLWYYTDRQEPSLAMFRGMGFTKALRPDLHVNGHVPGKHFDAAYRKGDDGLGYSFEYRIPWDALAVKRAPEPGDDLAASMAVFWGRPDGLKTAGGAAWAWNVMATPGFPFQSASVWGTWKFHPKGNIPREWVVGDLPPEQPLPLTFRYELPREGEATIQLFDESNESVRILVAQQRRPEGVDTESWDGLDENGEPLPAGKYRWRGLVHDPIKMEYRFSVHNSGNPPYPTDDNTGGWGADHGEPTVTLAIDGGMILAWDTTEYGWGIIRTDLEGQKQWGSKRTAEYLASDGKRLFVAGGHGWSATGGVSVLELGSSRAANFQPGLETLPVPAGKGSGKVTGLACDGKQIYVSYAGRDVIGVYDLKGNLTDQWQVVEPGRIDLRPDGRLVAFSGNRVMVVDRGKVNLLIDELEDPRGLAVSEEGEIFIALAGDLQQVHVFSAGGELVRTIGELGGRPAKGAYDPIGMYQPGGMDIDERGRLWVAETTDFPKRISVWDTGSGENLAEYFGSSGYFAYGHIDPANPDEILAHNVLWGIDWETYETRPLTTVWRKTAPDMIGPPGTSGYISRPRMITAENDQQYMYGRTRHDNIVMRREGDLFKPFLAVLREYPSGMVSREPAPGEDGPQLWQDANDDQSVQADELTAMGGGRTFQKVEVTLAHNLGLYISSGHRMRPLRITDAGQPIYDLAQIEKAPVGRAPEANGFVYRGYGSPVIDQRRPSGEVMWRYSDITMWKRALGKPPVGPGRLWGSTGLLGAAGDHVAYMTYFGVNHVFHRNGVYVAALLKDKRTSLTRGAYEGQPEGQGGSFVKLNLDGEERYFVIHGGQDSRVWEVLGLDTVQVISGGTYEHTPEAVATAREALAKWKAAMAGAAQLTIVRGRSNLDGAPAVSAAVDENRDFEARVAVDDQKLYVRYDVTTNHALTNATPEDQIVFRGGNCLDLQIATNPDADPDRETPDPGDVRLLVTRKQGRPFAMVYRPRVAGFTGTPIVLRSPTGVESFDCIRPTDRVQLDYEKTDDGFAAVIAVPLDLLAWTPESGQTVRMDVGYVFGNANGTRAAARAYWANNGFSANVVDDIPNESRLEPGQWGKAVVK